MPVKSVIDIEINDSKFKEFTALFDKYRTSLKEMPADWSAVGEEIHGAKTLFEGIIAGMLTQSQLSDHSTKNEKTQEQSTRNQAGYWKDMARSTRDVAGNIVKATESLLKWIGLTSVFTGLLGAGGLYGIDRMAIGVAAGRRSSLGLGTSYGGQKAFEIAYGQTVDPGAFLGSVNEGLHDLSKRGMFLGAGMNANDMKGDTATVAVNLLQHLKKIADNTNPAAMANMIQARGLNVSVEEMLRLRGTNMGELQSRFVDEQQRLDVNRKTQDTWSRFVMQMHDAGTSIENIFVKKLVALEPSLEKLSKGFVHLLETVAGSDMIETAIKKLGTGLDWFADEIGSESFGQSVKELLSNTGKVATGLAALGRGLEWVLKKFGVDFGDTAPTEAKQDQLRRLGTSNPVDVPRSGSIPSFDPIERAHGFPRGLLTEIAQRESSFNPNAVGPMTRFGQAKGLFQLSPENLGPLGVNDPFDPVQSTAGAVKLLDQLYRRYEGNTEMTVAAYNSRPSTVDAAMRKADSYGGNWRDELPNETRAYLARIMQSIAADRPRVDVHDNTGGSVNVSVSALSGGT